jgi:cell division septation protein DedD
MLGYQLSGISIKKQLPSKEEVASLMKKSRDISFYETLVEPPKKPADKKPAPSQSRSKAKTAKGYAVQVAAFKSRKSARKLRDELKEKGYPAYIAQNAKGEEEKWFRVRLGKYATRRQAQQAVQRLKQKTKFKPFIVQ